MDGSSQRREPAVVHHSIEESASTDLPLSPAMSGSVFVWSQRIPDPVRYIVVVVVWAAVLGVSHLVPGDYPGRRVVLLGHLLGIVIGFGAVMVVDWHGLLWLMGLRGPREVGRVSDTVSPLIWFGVAVLLATGCGLRPALGTPATWAKMIAVLMLCFNGVAAGTTRAVLGQLPEVLTLRSVPARERWRAVAGALVSQGCWMTAVVIGFAHA